MIFGRTNPIELTQNKELWFTELGLSGVYNLYVQIGNFFNGKSTLGPCGSTWLFQYLEEKRKFGVRHETSTKDGHSTFLVLVLENFTMERNHDPPFRKVTVRQKRD